MTEITIEIGDWLDTLALGAPIYRGTLPDTPDAAIALYPYGGPPDVRSFSGVEWECPHLHIETRAPTDLAARMRIELVRVAFEQVVNQVIGSAWYLTATVKQPPFLLEHDQKGRAVFALNVAIWRRGL